MSSKLHLYDSFLTTWIPVDMEWLILENDEKWILILSGVEHLFSVPPSATLASPGFLLDIEVMHSSSQLQFFSVSVIIF